MKKVQISKFWIAIAVVIFGGVCVFLPKDMSNMTASIVQVEEDSVCDTTSAEVVAVQ